MSVKALESLLQMSVKGYNAVFIGSHLQSCVSSARLCGRPETIIGERERANLVVRLARIFYIYISRCVCLSDPYKLQYFICDTRGPTRNPGKITT